MKKYHKHKAEIESGNLDDEIVGLQYNILDLGEGTAPEIQPKTETIEEAEYAEYED
jgi:hypothetical protein